MPFKKGQSGNPKGCPKGTHHKGRPSDKFRADCLDAFNEVDGLAFVKSIIAGVKYETSFGEMPARPEVRLSAVQWLAERGYGKVEQPMTINGDERPLHFVLDSELDALISKSAESVGAVGDGRETGEAKK